MRPLSRRRFMQKGIQAAGAASLFTIVPAQVLGRAAMAAPSERVTIAAIGLGGVGRHNLHNLDSQQIVALCDVDTEFAAPVFAEYPDARRYVDCRELFAQEKDLDAVLIATPDHTHAMITKAALEAGKHIYCQKPLTHTVYEARRITELAKDRGLTTQMGIQGHSMKDSSKLVEWIQGGVIGAVREVQAWCTLSYYPWGHAAWSAPRGTRPEETAPVPDSLNWDLWLGPAPWRPYHPCYHPAVWRPWLDFGSGMMGDRGVHTLDPVVWALQLGAPDTIEASCTDLNDDTHPIACIVRFSFPARGTMPPVVVNWYDGLEPPRPAVVGSPRDLGEPEGGALFIGDDGLLTCGIYGNSPRLLPAERMEGFTPPPEYLPRVSQSHEMDWVRACKAGEQAGADFSYSGPLTEITLLGNIAKRFPGTVLRWDSDAFAFENHAEANALLNPPARDGWGI